MVCISMGVLLSGFEKNGILGDFKNFEKIFYTFTITQKIVTRSLRSIKCEKK